MDSKVHQTIHTRGSRISDCKSLSQTMGLSSSTQNNRQLNHSGEENDQIAVSESSPFKSVNFKELSKEIIKRLNKQLERRF